MKEPFPCFECSSGFYATKLTDVEVLDGKGEKMIVPNVPFEVCDACGDTISGAAAGKMIDDAREKAGVVFRRGILAGPPKNPLGE